MKADSYTPQNGSASEKINDVDGFFAQYNDGVTFDYIKDGKLVELFAPNKEILVSLVK